jgi:hypothetical protein
VTQFLVHQESRNDADDFSALSQNRVGENSHQADVTPP